jgi:hypothetical protein
MFAVRKFRNRTSMTVANRSEISFFVGPVELSVVVRRAGEPDGFSREELCQMLLLVRADEKLEG